MMERGVLRIAWIPASEEWLRAAEADRRALNQQVAELNEALTDWYAKQHLVDQLTLHGWW